MARRLIPFALIIPAVLGWLRLYSARNGAFTVEFGVSILVLGIIICFVFVILYNAMLLNKRDKEERKAREALHTSERISDHLITSIRDYAIFMLDTEGRIASWNGGAHAIKGYDATEVLGRPIDIFYTEEALLRNEPRENLRMASMHGSYRSEGWRVRKSGARFWADVLFTALHDTRGSLQGFVKVTRDISEQKKADDVIRHQAQLIEDISDAIISMDRDFCIISWNKAAERLYGYSAEEARGQDAGILLRSRLDREVRQEVRKLLREQGYWYGEVKHFTKANVALDVLVSASGLRDEHNVVAGFVTVCRDISERRHAEQRLISFNEELTRQVNEKTEELRDIFERVTDAFTAFDKWGNIVYTNRRANEIMGPSAAKVGMNVWEYYPNTAKSGFKDAFDRAMATQQEQHLEVYAAAMNLWLEEHLYPSQKGVSLIFRDITEEKKVREDLSRSHEDMRALASHLQDIREEERAHIAREIHDELGQQLTGLKMDLGWIDDQLERLEARVLRDRIGGSLRLLDHTIMTVRKIAAELRPGILDDLGLVAAIEWHAEEFEKRSGIRARFRAGMPGRRYPSAMSIGLFRICQEALTNVARHSGAQHVDIFLGYEEDRIVLRVSDDGRGLPEEGHGVRKTLGLLGIKERAMMLGGILEVASKTGEGVILTVSVPIGISEQSS
jgi:PAS domain S-box-containing protein